MADWLRRKIDATIGPNKKMVEVHYLPTHPPPDQKQTPHFAPMGHLGLPIFGSLDEMVAFIDEKYPGIEGRQQASPVDGHGYEAIYVAQVCRADDVEIFRSLVVQLAAQKVVEYLDGSGRRGPVHWRMRPEEDQQKISLVTKYHPEGEHIDFATDCRFSDDGNDWRAVKFYCRLWRSPGESDDQEVQGKAR